MPQGAFKVTEKLKKWLELKGWTQRQFADELGCDESVVSRFMDPNTPAHPSWQMLRKLCIMTGLGIGEILAFDRNEDQEES